MLVSIAVDADRLAGAGRAGDQQVRHRREVGDVRLAVDRLAERDRRASTSIADRRPTRAARAARSARALRFGIWMPTVDLPGMRSISTDSACIARHRSSARPVIFEYFTPASGLNSNVVTTGPGWICTTEPSTENSRHFSSSSRAAVHQLALVDLALGLRRVEQRERRQRVVALAPLGRRLRRRLRIRTAASGSALGKVHLGRLRRRERSGRCRRPALRCGGLRRRRRVIVVAADDLRCRAPSSSDARRVSAALRSRARDRRGGASALAAGGCASATGALSSCAWRSRSRRCCSRRALLAPLAERRRRRARRRPSTPSISAREESAERELRRS